MKHVDILLVGGGSGGHITPLVSVAEAAKKVNPAYRLVHIGHVGDALNDVTRKAEVIDAVYEVQAGKFRRYHTDSRLKQLLDLKTNALNVRDFFRFLRGTFQAWRLLGKMKPKVIFMKGGYVCANVGIAAKLRGVPYVTHDSDAMVSLAHRVIAKDAALHLTALQPQFYPEYDQSKTVQVGIPVKEVFAKVSKAQQDSAKKQLGIPANDAFVLITGGGLGAQNMNNAVIQNAELLVSNNTHIRLLTGIKNYDALQSSYDVLPVDIKKYLTLEPFTNEMQLLSAAADLIVTRASMTAVTEFGVQAKASLLIPNPLLSGGHQLKNAAALTENESVEVLAEADLHTIGESVQELLADEAKRKKLAKNLHEITIQGAADKIVEYLLQEMRN